MLAYENDVDKRPAVAAASNRVMVQVVRREVLMDGVVRLSLAMPGTIRAPAASIPGQFITLALPIRGQVLRRSYSLCGSGRADQPWVITIKRQQMGVVSTYLYEQAREGVILQASLPQGSFVLPARVVPAMPLIFVAAGSGITPIIGMLGALALLPPEQRPAVQLHYAARSPAETIYLRELEALDPESRWLRRSYYFSAQGARLTPQKVLAQVGQLAARARERPTGARMAEPGEAKRPPPLAQAHWYICGPEALKRDLQQHLAAAAIPAQQVHVETFVSPAAPAASGDVSQFPGAAKGARLRVADTGAVLHVQPHETLLTALEGHGYTPDFSCRAGACGTCKLRLLEGKVAQAGDALSRAERQAGYVLSCVARPLGDVTIASAGQPPARGLAWASTRGSTLARRKRAIRRMRLLTAVVALGLVFGSWSLVNYKASSAQTASTSSSSSQSSGSGQQSTPSSSSSAGSSSGSSTSSTSSAAPSSNTQSGTS